MRRFRLTSYWVATLTTEGKDLVQIYDEQGKPLLLLPRASKSALDLEGSGRLPDGRVLNVSDIPQARYRVLPAGWLATGTGGRRLTPFRSVAADQGTDGGRYPWKDSVTRGGPLLTVDTRLYIQELDGVRLPDGSAHDGWVTVEDTGGAIYGAHLDLFVGERRDRISHPDLVQVTFDGVSEIPEDYTYGLIKVQDYKSQRPPKPRPRVA